MRRKTIKVKITLKELIDARDVRQLANHRELVIEKFLKEGWVVVNFMELKFFNHAWGYTIEGVTGEALLAK